ncbi:MAG: PH domain-containing protein [Planctomycetota bacterium]|nr:MAG: PH domain-containing protein [Planctomycetota bacterium]
MVTGTRESAFRHKYLPLPPRMAITMSNDEQTPPAPASNPSQSPREQFESAVAKANSGDDNRNVPERTLWQGGYCAKAMYGTWIGSAVVTVLVLVAVALFARGDNAGTIWAIAGAAILLWWCVAIGVYLYRKFSVHYELTTQRFIHQSGLLTRTTDRIEVIDIDDVSFTQGIIQRMLGVGTITITSSDRSHPKLVLYGIDKVPEVATLIDDVRREERRRRSLHIESI